MSSHQSSAAAATARSPKLESSHNNKPTKHKNSITYDVLPRLVRYELNKFFFEVTQNPSRAQRIQLWYDLQMMNSHSNELEMCKVVKWFYNKRAYMKKKYGKLDGAIENGSIGTFENDLASMTLDLKATYSDSDSSEESDSDSS